MFSDKDLQQIIGRGSDPQEISRQIDYFRKGFSWLPVVKAASPGNGIVRISDQEMGQLEQIFRRRLLRVSGS